MFDGQPVQDVRIDDASVVVQRRGVGGGIEVEIPDGFKPFDLSDEVGSLQFPWAVAGPVVGFVSSHGICIPWRVVDRRSQCRTGAAVTAPPTIRTTASGK
jgi:hypothetical protein